MMTKNKTNTTYLNRVLIYLQQELTEKYREHIKLAGEKLVITLPDEGSFQLGYEALHQTIVSSISRIRSRDIDLDFTVKSVCQERDFKILK
jgi:chitinase